MAGTVFSLLVGINDYGGNPTPLFGCRSDVAAMSGLLRERVGAERYSEEILLDGEATRERVIDRFGAHLGRAGAGDVAVFVFSGHGSYEPVEERFWFLEPTGQNQTLVCADSRTKRAGDLADKELNELIRAVAANGPHVLVILDCCHSGGGTRDPAGLPAGVRARLAPPATEPRPLDAYLPAVRAAVDAAARAAAPGTRTATAPGLGHPRHVALSACEPTQLSKEIPVGATTRGAFSLALERALTTLPPTATYRDLVGAAANAVRNQVADQDPVVFVEGEEVDQPFLGGTGRARAAVIALEHEAEGWFVDVGRLHGVQEPRDGSTTVLGVRGVAGAAAPDALLGHVRIVRVEPTRSAVEAVGFSPEPGTRYDAVITEVPAPVVTVELQGEPGGVEAVRRALPASPYVREGAPVDGGLHLTVRAADGRLTIARADGAPITDAVTADDAGAERTVRRLDHLARWHEIRDLANPTSSLADQVAIEVVPAQPDEGAPPPAGDRAAIAADTTGVVRLAYQRRGDTWQPPAVFIYLHNRSDRKLYCTLLDMTDRYRSNSTLFAVSELAPGASTVAFGGRPVAFSVPEERLRLGGTRVRDWLKLVVSERRFDTSAFDLPLLDGVLPAEQRWFDTERTRDAGGADAGPPAPDWATVMTTVVTERPDEGVTVPENGAADVGGVVAVEAHPALRGARARLGSAASTTRSAAGGYEALARIVQDPTVAVPLRLSGTRSTGDAGADHLELKGDLDVGQVTPETPLRLRLAVGIDDDDVVLAVGQDGDLFIPLGTGTRTAAGAVDVALTRLPAGGGGDAATRGLGRSVRIFFQRIIDRRLGRDSSWPRLGLAVRAAGGPGEPGESGDGDVAVELVTDRDAIASAVASGGRRLLVVHGLLGDTRTMLDPLVAALGDRYDSVLTFDYDTVGASVEESATALADRLTAVGVDADHPVDVVAVSTGALVVRWLVERLQHDRLVRRAVLVGSPNAGSPWADVQGWATTMLAIGINGLAKAVWPAAALGWLVAAFERLDAGLDDLAPNSAALTALAAPGPATVPYALIVGTSSIGGGAAVDATAPATAEADDSRLGRLLRRLGTAAAGWALFRQPNDLVASAASQRALPAGRADAVTEVPCDHLTYFARRDTLVAISEALP